MVPRCGEFGLLQEWRERVVNGLVHVQGIGILFWIQNMMAMRAADNGISMLLFLGMRN